MADAWAAQMRERYLSPDAMYRPTMNNWNTAGGNDVTNDGYRHFSADPVTGEFIDQNGKPAPTMYADASKYTDRDALNYLLYGPRPDQAFTAGAQRGVGSLLDFFNAYGAAVKDTLTGTGFATPGSAFSQARDEGARNQQQFNQQWHSTSLDNLFSDDPIARGQSINSLFAYGGEIAGQAAPLALAPEVMAGMRMSRFALSSSMDSIGATRFGRFSSIDEFSSETFARYQQYTNEGYARALRLEENGGLLIPEGVSRETVLGQRTDAFARVRMDRWLQSEGIAEGPGQSIQLNRWLRDPSGGGAYRIPDVRIPENNLIMDSTIGYKWQSNPQITDFYNFSGGSRITILRPTGLGGSYSLLPLAP
jgi:hypothetical protein